MESNQAHHNKRENLEADLYQSPEILAKVKKMSYAQNLYAALCNNDWQKREVFPILSDDVWYGSWRLVGGIVARLRNEGDDYMNFYCTGINHDEDLKREGFVVEGTVTDEIIADLAKLNWHLVNEDEGTYP